MNPEETTNSVEIAKPDVQHVVASRAGASADAPADALQSAVQGTATVLTSGGSAFFTTLKRMLLLALVLALAAAWWAEEGAIARGIAAAVIVFIPVAVVSLLLAGQRATVAIAIETWRQTGLARKLLDLLLDEVARPAADAAPTMRLSISEACLRLKVAIVDWKASNTASSSLIRRSQQWIGSLIEKIVSAAFHERVGQGGIDVNEVRQDLATRIDDLVAARVRRRTRFATFAAVFASICWAFGVAYLLHVMARG